MCVDIKPKLCQPDVIILNCRTNDIINEISTLIKLKKFLKEIEGYDKDIKNINEKI